MGLKDVLHFYGIGTEVNFDGKIWEITELKRNTIKGIRLDHSHSNEFYYHHCKPLLRPLSDMTEEEIKIYESMQSRLWEQFVWLLKNRFDLFNLISSGQAIDKTKM